MDILILTIIALISFCCLVWCILVLRKSLKPKNKSLIRYGKIFAPKPWPNPPNMPKPKDDYND